MNTRTIRLLLTAVPAISCPIPGIAQVKRDVRAGATLEELMKIEVTSAGRKEQRAGDVPASIFVITQDDIRRSRITTTLSIAAASVNLFDRTHVEFSGANIGMAATRVPRNGHVQLTWRF